MQFPLRCMILFGLSLALGMAAFLAPSADAAHRPGVISTKVGSVTLSGGKVLGFTAETGMIPVRGEDSGNAPIGGLFDANSGLPIALMSYVAYFGDTADRSKRPVLFLWDGGPGASSRGLVVDSFGPVRAEIPGPRQALPGPSPAALNNPDSLLDVADLVFIDAPGTGFGRIEGRGAPAAFYGIDGDAAAFTHFIERFLTAHGREASPLFLFGHSYGTMRASVVAHELDEDDVAPRGIVSVSQWLNNDDNVSAATAHPGTDNAYIDALPSYAATAWYHHRLLNPSPSLRPFLDQVEGFALGDYASALLAGSTLPIARERAIAATLERITSIPAATWIAADLRIDGPHFQRLLLGDPGQTVGRLDTRYTGPVTDPSASIPDTDPFGSATGPTLAAAGATYERDVLGGGRDAAFSPDADVPDLKWNGYHSTDGKPWDSFYNVIPDLAAVLIGQPGTRFLMMGGYYDLSTTYLGAIEDLRHLPIPTALRGNISVALFPTGHEPYLQDDVRHTMHDMIARFIQAKLPVPDVR